MSIVRELRRRNVFKVVVAYIITAWLVMQIADVILNNVEAPGWVFHVILLLLGIGFPFAIIFAWAYEITPQGIKREHEVDRSQSITHLTSRKLDFAIIGLLVLALGYFAFDKFVLGPVRDAELTEAAVRAATEEQAPVEVEKSIAVLPFVNMSDDAGNEYFSDGISEEILNALARVKELKVTGRTSSFAFKDRNQDLRQIGDALGVEHILEGSVRKVGTMVRITAQLIKVEDGFHLWSDTYDRELTDVFAIQDEIADAILEQLKAHLLEDEKAVLTSTRTDPKTYDLYLLARQRIYDRNRLSIEAAIELLDTAIALDPKYAPAYAQRGIATLLLVEEQYGNLPQEQSDPLGKQYLDKALELDPGLAEAWAGIGLYHSGRPREHLQAIQTLEKALAINPNLIDASNWLQIAYGNAGKNAAILPIIEDMLERDPLYRPGISNAVLKYNRLGQQEKSLALLERVRPFMPNHPALLMNLAKTHFSLGEFSKGLPLAEEAVRQRPDDGTFKTFLGFGLWNMHQYDRMMELDIPFITIYALDVLGRTEEATILAYEEAASGYVGPLFALLNRSGRSADLIRFFEDRWPDLDSLEADFPHDDVVFCLMNNVAFAYLRADNERRFNDAMARVRAAHDQLIGGGVQDALFFWREAVYYTMAGDHDTAIAQLGLAIDKGVIGDLRLARVSPALEPLEGDPRYEAIQARMIENLNTQRAALGLEPATI